VAGNLSANDTQVEQKSMKQQLDDLTQASKNKLPAEKRAVMDNAIKELERSSVMKTALHEGQDMPPFQLKNAKGEVVNSSSLLKKSSLVVVFYRGSWCPYCNIQLHALQAGLPEIKSAGGDLVAISPEKPDGSLTLIQKHNLTFQVLSDPNLKVSKEFGIVYRLPEELQKIYLSFGNDLRKVNGTKDWDLPLAATYVVDGKGRIIYSFVDADYKKRAELSDILKALKKIPPKS
jgi:peroxiredoxin